jgi:hypothetical protein
MMKTFTLAVALLALTTPGRAAEKSTPVAVYLAPPAGAFQDPQRIDSTRDLRAQLAQTKKDVRLVDRPEDALVIVEVLDRTETELGTKIVAVKLTIGEYTTTLRGHNPSVGMGSLGSNWRAAAQAVATQIKQFLRANAQKLRN